MYRIKSYAYSYRLEGETEGWNHKGGIWNKKKYNWIEKQMKGESVKKLSMKKLNRVLMVTLSLAMALSTLTVFSSAKVSANSSSYRGLLTEVKSAVVDKNN